MTDTMFTRTALTEAAEKAGVTADQARTILEAAGVKVQPAPGWYLTEDGEVARVKPNKHTGALILNIDGDVLLPHQPWPKLTPARIVPAATTPVTLTEEQVGELWGKEPALQAEKSALQVAWRVIGPRNRERITATVNAALAQHAAPAEGEQIDPTDVQVGDQVRVELEKGDEATFTVHAATANYLCSREHTYHFDIIRAVRLLHREDRA